MSFLSSSLQVLTRDVRQAGRRLRARPGGPLVIVLSLAFAIGVSVGVFSIVNAVWFSPWHARDADALRVIHPAVTLDDF